MSDMPTGFAGYCCALMPGWPGILFLNTEFPHRGDHAHWPTGDQSTNEEPTRKNDMPPGTLLTQQPGQWGRVLDREQESAPPLHPCPRVMGIRVWSLV